MNKLTILFDSNAQLMEFTLWLNNQGEQNYWDWLDLRSFPQNHIKYDYSKKEITISG